MSKIMKSVRKWARSVLSSVGGWLGDHPTRTNLILFGIAAVHTVALLIWPSLDVWTGLLSDSQSPETLALALVTAGALLAGFAGVVVIFGLQNNSERFRKLRRQGGGELKQNWSSMSAAGFWTMGLAIVSALGYMAESAIVGGQFLELSLLVLAHGSIRLIWVLQQLIGVVSTEDELADRRDRTVATELMPWNSRPKHKSN